MAKTLRQQITETEAKVADLQAKLTALRVQADAEVNFDHIVPGAVLQFSYGKGENKRTVQGAVVAVKPADPAAPKSAPQVKLAFGEGFDAQFAVVYFAAVEAVISSPAKAVEQAETDTDTPAAE